jgi:hypothetical protein
MMGFDANSFDRLLEKIDPFFSGHMTFDTSGMIVKFKCTRGQKGKFSLRTALS